MAQYWHMPGDVPSCRDCRPACWRQLRQNVSDAQKQQVSQRATTLLLDHFVKGIQHLGDGNADVRLGGVYSLGMLAEESSAHRQAVGGCPAVFRSESLGSATRSGSLGRTRT